MKRKKIYLIYYYEHYLYERPNEDILTYKSKLEDALEFCEAYTASSMFEWEKRGERSFYSKVDEYEARELSILEVENLTFEEHIIRHE